MRPWRILSWEGRLAPLIGSTYREAVKRAPLRDGPEDASDCLLLAHRQGADDFTPALARIAAGVGESGIAVVRFDLGDGPEVAVHEQLLAEAMALTAAPGRRTVVIGGYSLGARVAAGVARQLEPNGLICLAYPFHPHGGPTTEARIELLRQSGAPTLVVQGTRDSHGNREQVRGYRLPEHVQIHWLEDANHGFRRRVASARGFHELIDDVVEQMVGFIQRCR